MATATVNIWRDTGFMEGAIEVPSKTSSLPTPNYTFNNLNIPVDSLFGSIKLKEPFEDLYDCSYLRITLDMNNGADVTIYGWIDAVSCSSDTAGYPMTVISWHPDLWRTYLPKATFGKGLVTRRPYTSDCPPQVYPYKYRTMSSRRTLIQSPNTWWVVFRFVQKERFLNNLITASCIGAFPFSIVDQNKMYTVSGEGFTESGNVEASTIPFSFIAAGFFEEFFKMDPGALVSVFLCPFDPFGCNVSGDTYSKPGLSVYRAEPLPGAEKFGFLVSTSANWFHEYDITTTAQTTNDVQTAVITDWEGNSVGEIPWGCSISKWHYRLVMDSSSAYINIRGEPNFGTYSTAVGTQAPIHGTSFTIPLVPMEITENSLGSYMWSGQRAADRQALQNQALMGVIGGLTGIPGTAMQAQMMFNAGGNTSLLRDMAVVNRFDADVARYQSGLGPSPASIGRVERVSAARENIALANQASKMLTKNMIGMSLVGTGAKAAMDVINIGTTLANASNQAAAQTNNLVMQGTGFDMLMYGEGIEVKTMSIDPYSQTQRSQDLAYNGAAVAEPRNDIASLIAAGGPLQVKNLVVGGSIPVPAKEYIKQRLESGVRII